MSGMKSTLSCDSIFSSLTTALNHLDADFSQSTVGSFRQLRMQRHWNKGNCALTDGPLVAISGGKAEKYNKPVIPPYLAAPIYLKGSESAGNTLYFSPNQQGNPICEYLDAAVGVAKYLSEHVTGASSIVCKAVNPDGKAQTEKCSDGI